MFLGTLLGDGFWEPYLQAVGVGTLLGHLLLGTVAWEPLPENFAWEPLPEYLLVLGGLFLGTLLGNLGQCGFGCSDPLRDLYHG